MNEWMRLSSPVRLLIKAIPLVRQQFQVLVRAVLGDRQVRFPQYHPGDRDRVDGISCLFRPRW